MDIEHSGSAPEAHEQCGDGGFTLIDAEHVYEVRDNVALISGPDGWHGEDFQLPW
jgi:hypothetical protein